MDSNFLTILILVVFLIIIPIQIKGIYEYYKDKENVKNDKVKKIETKKKNIK